MERESGPLIVAMKGHPGTGKSTVACAIAAALRFPLLDKDDIRDPTLPLQTHLIHNSTSAAAPAAALLNDLSYAVLWRLADTQLRLGLSIIIDCPLSRRSHLDRLLSLAAASAARLKVVECRPGDEGEWRRRLEARAAGGEGWHKPASWGELRRLVEGYEGGSDYEFGGVERLLLDTTAEGETVETLVGRVLDFVRSK